MRTIGFISAADPEPILLGSIERCLRDHCCERVFLLREGLIESLSNCAPPDLIETVLGGSAEQIDELLAARRKARLLERTYSLPKPPKKAIELVGDRLILLTAQKGSLDEEDIANVDAVLFGDSKEPFAKPFGSRIFASPGDGAGAYGILFRDARGGLETKIFSQDGSLLAHAATEGKRPRFSITS